MSNSLIRQIFHSHNTRLLFCKTVNAECHLCNIYTVMIGWTGVCQGDKNLYGRDKQQQGCHNISWKGGMQLQRASRNWASQSLVSTPVVRQSVGWLSYGVIVHKTLKFCNSGRGKQHRYLGAVSQASDRSSHYIVLHCLEKTGKKQMWFRYFTKTH